MKFDVAERPNILPWPPLIYAAAAVAAYGLGKLLPLALPPDRAVRYAGAALAGAGLALDFSAMAVMWRARTNIFPHRGADALITSGPFRWTRNPIYLGNTLMMLGLSLGLDNLWFAALGLAAAALVHHLAIRREEIHLAQRFGEAWRSYATRTPRWLFRHF